ncbi:Sterol carrier protein domain-containing protein [Streptomyces sp. di188]|nr:Sterol carrier protein domain-containing protein [Streptomyces sp. di188]SCD49806.1 Sterol carrier protein domain-containing protein [Streptomyces sp. di50b]
MVLSALDALDPAAGAALWRFLFDLDLTSTLLVRGRPVDDAWQYLVKDVRRCRPALRDALYVRPVEVGTALAARTYRAPEDVVLDVEDASCPWNAGRRRLSGDARGAVCEPTRDAAGLALSVRELGAAYLGGVSLTSLGAAGRVRKLREGALRAAGRVRKLREGALAEASAAFGSDPAPWLPHGF